jgi:hypothetical protein
MKALALRLAYSLIVYVTMGFKASVAPRKVAQMVAAMA